jgi:hypothetical protein
MKSINFWDITPCGPLNVNRRFGGTYGLHHQGRRIAQQETRGCACHLIHADFLLGLFFDPEDVGDMFLRNVGLLSTDYRRYTPEDNTLCPLLLL